MRSYYYSHYYICLLQLSPRMHAGLKTHSEFGRPHSDFCNIRITLHSYYLGRIKRDSSKKALNLHYTNITWKKNQHLLYVLSKILGNCFYWQKFSKHQTLQYASCRKPTLLYERNCLWSSCNIWPSLESREVQRSTARKETILNRAGHIPTLP